MSKQVFCPFVRENCREDCKFYNQTAVGQCTIFDGLNNFWRIHAIQDAVTSVEDSVKALENKH